jgi:hypothetical protein
MVAPARTAWATHASKTKSRKAGDHCGGQRYPGHRRYASTTWHSQELVCLLERPGVKQEHGQREFAEAVKVVEDMLRSRGERRGLADTVLSDEEFEAIQHSFWA